jgi:anti-anti-sigma factor
MIAPCNDHDPQGILCPSCDKEKNTMADTTITHEDIGEDLRRIVIAGRLDTPGTNEISPALHELAAAPIRGVIVDLSAVEFAASIAIGQVIATAQEVKARGGHMVVLASGTSSVMMTLKMGAIDRVIPVFQYFHEAHMGALRGF